MLIGVVGTALRAGANLILLPLVVTHLDPEEQALWWVLIALGNFAFLADLGFGSAIVRVYSYFWAGAQDFKTEGLMPTSTGEPNLDGICRLNTTVRYLFLRLCSGSILLLAVVGTLVLYKPVQELPNSMDGWIAWAIYLMAIWYSIFTSQWFLTLQGINRVREMHMAYVVSSLSYVAVTSILLLLDWGLMGMAVATVVRAFAQRWVGRTAVFRAIPQLRAVSEQPDVTMLKRLWPNAKKFAILSLGSYFIGNTSILVSSQLLGSSVTASLGVTNQLAFFLVAFASLWTSVKWPEITVLRTQQRVDEMSVLFSRRLGLAALTFILGAIAITLIGNDLLELKGAKTRLLPMPYLIFFLVYAGLQMIYVQFGTLALTENVIPFFRISIITGLAVVTLSLLFTPSFGLWGLLSAPFIAEWAYSGWYTIQRGFQGQHFTPIQFLRSVLRLPIKT